MIFVVYETRISDAKANKYHVKLLAAKASIASGAHNLRAYLDSPAVTVVSISNIGHESAAFANTSDILDYDC